MTAFRFFLAFTVSLLAGCSAPASGSSGFLHYLEIVCNDVEAQCSALESIHGLRFGAEQADYGNARTAATSDGGLVGVRRPLASHETPIIRTYLVVDDIAAAVQAAATAGAVIAYPPTKQGDSGTWAIYIQGGIQHGLWERIK